MTGRSIATTVERYYSAAVERHGPTPHGVDWNSAESQRVRFQQLLRALPGRAYSINDYGCGYGALIPVLREAGEPFTYTGYDLSEAMVAHACTTYSSPSIRFTTNQADLEVADVTVASGIFNVRFDFDDATWGAYVAETIDRLAELSSHAFSFNMLTSYSDRDRMRPDLYYADPCEVFRMCKRSIAPAVALLHDYGLWEFTIVVTKGV
jgi:SAM-dependent methyltransferase